MDDDLRAEAGRRGKDDVEVIREALARELGRMQARDEMTELRKAVSELTSVVTKLTSVVAKLTSVVTSVQHDLRALLQRLPRV